MSEQGKLIENIKVIKTLSAEDLARLIQIGAETEHLIKKNTPALLRLNKCKVKHCNKTQKNKMKQCLKKHCKNQTMKLKPFKKNITKIVNKHFTKKEQKKLKYLLKKLNN